MRRAAIQTAGFSLMEGLVVVLIIGLLASVVVPTMTGGPDAAKKAKLDQDVVIVNNAIDAYLMAGGAQGGLSAANVIETLKQRINAGPIAEMSGPQGPFLDPSVVTNATDFAWSARFEAGSRPRFVVERSAAGVVFARGLPSPVGGVAQRPDAARGSWLWSYTAAAPTTAGTFYEPPKTASETQLGTTNTVLAGLDAPVITPSSQTLNLWGFPLFVSIGNPNDEGTSLVYYSVNGGPYVLYDGTPFEVGPGASLSAVAVTIDPSRYYNSPESLAEYQVIPLRLAVRVTAPTTVTYAQAGGQMLNQALLAPATAVITLEDTSGGAPDNLVTRDTADGSDKYIPPQYLSSAGFTLKYTTDGTDPLSSATAQTSPDFNGFFSPVPVSLGLPIWGTNSAVTVTAVAVSANPALFTTSASASGTSTVQQTILPITVVPANPIGLPFEMRLLEGTNVPVGLRKVYTTSGTAPLTSTAGGFVVPGARVYTAPVPATSLPGTSYALAAQATGPAGYEQWFASPLAGRSYSTVTVLNPDFVGANISGGDVNGSFRGSIFVSAPANLGIFNAGGQILNGNLYVPGLPGIDIPGSGNSTKTVVSRGAYFDQSTVIPRTLIAGKEISADGVLADPQLDRRQIVDLNGSGVPTNYTVKLTKSSFIEGKIYRNVDVPPPPPVPVAPLGLSRVTGTISGVPATNLLSGIYSNNITMNSTGSVIRLGIAGATAPTQYIFTGNTFAKGTVEILGPVEIYFTTGFVNSGVVFGGTNTVDQLRINVMGGDVDIKSGGAVYASLWATNNIAVGNGGIFFGNIYAQTLNVAPGGTVNVEPQL